MRITVRPLAPGEIDYELIGLTTSAVAFGLATCWFVLHLPWPICVFHELTGRPCLSCGMTRSAIALFQAHFFTALKWNPLACLAYCGVALFDGYAMAAILNRGRRIRADFKPGEKRIIRGVVVAVLLVNWAYLLAHSSMF